MGARARTGHKSQINKKVDWPEGALKHLDELKQEPRKHGEPLLKRAVEKLTDDDNVHKACEARGIDLQDLVGKTTRQMRITKVGKSMQVNMGAAPLLLSCVQPLRVCACSFL